MGRASCDASPLRTEPCAPRTQHRHAGEASATCGDVAWRSTPKVLTLRNVHAVVACAIEEVTRDGMHTFACSESSEVSDAHERRVHGRGSPLATSPSPDGSRRQRDAQLLAAGTARGVEVPRELSTLKSRNVHFGLRNRARGEKTRRRATQQRRDHWRRSPLHRVVDRSHAL